MRNHEAAVQPGIRHEEVGQTAQTAHQTIDSALRDVRQFAHRDREEVDGQCNGFAVEVSSGNDEIFVGADNRVVGRRVDFDVDDRFHVAKRVLHRAVHLRNATERIRVLHVDLLASDEFTAVEQFAEPTRRINLPEMRSHGVDSVSKRLNSSVESIERHRRNHVGPVREASCLQQRPHGESTHILRAVEQRQALFRGHFNRFPTHPAQHFRSTDHFALHFHLALADERQTKVCQRHQVARSAERTLPINHRRDVVVVEINEPLHRVEFAARIAVTERLDFQQQHDPNDVVFNPLPHAASVTFDEVDLQLRQFVLAHRHVAQRAEACRHAIDRLRLACNFLVEILAAAHDSMACVVAQGQFFVSPDNFADALNREMLGTDLMDVHRFWFLVSFDLWRKDTKNCENVKIFSKIIHFQPPKTPSKAGRRVRVLRRRWDFSRRDE